MVWNLPASENYFQGIVSKSLKFSQKSLKFSETLMLQSRTPLVGFFGNGEIGVSHLPSDSGGLLVLI